MRFEAARFLLLATSSFFLVAHAVQKYGLAGKSVTASCIPHERDALLAFKKGIKSDQSGLFHSWQRQGGHDEQDCCRWRGVRCSNQTGHVLGLHLRNEHGGSNTDWWDTGLVGQITRSLLSLEHLEHLDLSWNNLEGSTGNIPKYIGSLSNLKYLNLSGIPFTSVVPHQLGNLSKLQFLDLSHSGRKHSSDLSWLKNLRLLQYLNLHLVDLSNVKDWLQVVNMIPSLRILDLSVCSLNSSNQSLTKLNFTNLEYLNLHSNYFNLPIESSWFWNLTNIKYLSLHDSNWYGHLPSALEGMEHLEYIDLSGNMINMSMTSFRNLCSLRSLYLEGCFSYGNVTELIESLPHCSSNRLQELHLGSNQLKGFLPKWMGHLTSLVLLDASKNNITGRLPPFIRHFTRLRTLDLSTNRLIGSLPDEISFLSSLSHLDLNNNNLYGLMTEENVDGLKSLRHIDMSYNSLKVQISSEWQPPFRLHYASFAACQMGPLFPAWLQMHKDIYYLDISNTGIIDRLPHWFAKTFSNAIHVNVSNNQLNGVLPTNMKIMSVNELDLNCNNLSGPIPQFPTNLEYLDFSKNSLSGPLPTNLTLPGLSLLSIFSNRITGRISRSICKCEWLLILDVANNLIEGELPVCFGNRITTLVISNNSFSGKFPSFLKNCMNMQLLDLAGNKFSGRLPLWIGNLVRLKFLRISQNLFYGSIPRNITTLQCLQYVDVSNNAISGSLPRHLSSLKAMINNATTNYNTQFYPVQLGCEYDGLENYKLVSLSADMKGQRLDYDSIYRIFDTNMVSIDLSSNNLTGIIPDEIGTLDALVNLNLARNHLTGCVASTVGTMQSLESLDLSRNNFSCEIPTSLANLTFLSYLDLSYNNFTGRIPSGAQLDTLYDEHPFMYDENIGLCGDPVKKKCSSIDVSKKHLEGSEEVFVMDFFYLGLGCGFTAGIWIVFCAILFNERWRISCFCVFDMLYDKAYVLLVHTWARLTSRKKLVIS